MLHQPADPATGNSGGKGQYPFINTGARRKAVPRIYVKECDYVEQFEDRNEVELRFWCVVDPDDGGRRL